jgi:hypothetical protein
MAEALLGGISPPRRRGNRVIVSAALVCAVIVGVVLLVGFPARPGSLLGQAIRKILPGRLQRLAYDSPTDTPPVTWYFPAGSTENTLGYTWNEAQVHILHNLNPCPAARFAMGS